MVLSPPHGPPDRAKLRLPDQLMVAEEQELFILLAAFSCEPGPVGPRTETLDLDARIVVFLLAVKCRNCGGGAGGAPHAVTNLGKQELHHVHERLVPQNVTVPS